MKREDRQSGDAAAGPWTLIGEFPDYLKRSGAEILAANWDEGAMWVVSWREPHGFPIQGITHFAEIYPMQVGDSGAVEGEVVDIVVEANFEDGSSRLKRSQMNTADYNVENKLEHGIWRISIEDLFDDATQNGYSLSRITVMLDSPRLILDRWWVLQ